MFASGSTLYGERWPAIFEQHCKPRVRKRVPVQSGGPDTIASQASVNNVGKHNKVFVG